MSALEPMGPLELAEQPVATLEELRRGRDDAGPMPLAADESVATVADARAAAGSGLRRRDGQAREGRRRRRGARDRARSCRVYLSSALDGPVGIAAAAHLAQALPADAAFAHGLATQLLFEDTIAAARVRRSTARRSPARRPRASASRSTSGALGLRHRTRADRVSFATWTRPTATPPSPPRSSEELARAGVEHACVAPGLALGPARARALERAGNPRLEPRRRALRRLLRARHRPADRPAGRRPDDLGHGGRQPPPRGRGGRRGARAADRRSPPTGPPELRGRGAGQTIDQLKLYGSAVRWFCELGVQEADDAGLLHYRSAAVRAVAEAHRPPARPGAPERRRCSEPLAPGPGRRATSTAEDDAGARGRGRTARR